MIRLRLAREAFSYSIDRLADELGIPIKTIRSWEDGAVIPKLPELRDLAVVYGTSVDDMSGDAPLADRPVRSIYMTDDEGIDGFWGHVGALLPASRSYRWYPITANAAETIAAEIERRSFGEEDFRTLLVETLNNRFLWLNLTAVNGVCLCHDAAEWPEPYGDRTYGCGLSQMDLEVRPDHLLSGEYYQVMTEMVEGEEADTDRASGRLIDQVRTILSERGDALGQDELVRLLLHARLWMPDGSCQWIEVSAESMTDAISDLQLDAGDGFLRLNGPDDGYLSYAISLERVAVLELPAARVRAGGRDPGAH